MILASALKKLLVKGYKSDNGFRSGYQNVLEQSMIQVIPGTDLRADTHISSSIHVWKENYGSIKAMLSRSGFGWNDATHTVVPGSDQVWTEYVKRKSTDDSHTGEYMKMMLWFCENTDAKLGDIAKRIGFEHDASMWRKSVFEELSGINQLDMESKIYVAKLLVNNTKDLDLFFSLPVDGKTTMLKMMLDGRY
ncbi:hypothetical protein BUALT_Bualt08G0024600 [Buddleja alternifolia]|uniref:Myb/SANT-like domain-containing protein n=1 Tax=Buddleja alternifolia TaxID=168488 RepID=A0AAV6XAC1_9LAMI|nr:hypothetical protein BUALT_Bualt08G0024600 [Buddleja alternifolia]